MLKRVEEVFIAFYFECFDEKISINISFVCLYGEGMFDKIA